MQATWDTPAADATDAELLDRYARSADEAAFSEIVRRHSPLVLAITRRRMGNSGFAEDAAQQVFIALSRRSRRLRAIPCLPAWLQKAAVYESATILRREARQRRRALQSSELDSPEEASAQGADIDQALASLPSPDRQILLLHHFEKLRYEQIAQRMGITAAAAQRRGHRAMERLARLLKGGTKDEAACAMWLAAGLVPREIEVPATFLSRTVALKKPAAFTLPWVPVLASVLIGGAVLAVAQKKAEPAPAIVKAPEPSPAPTRAEARKLRPVLADEKLSDELREFIARAKADSKDAWEWVRLRPQGADGFLKDSVRHLADRDMSAAERLLDVVEGESERIRIIAGIFDARAEGNFDAAIVWVDAFPKVSERRSVLYSQSYFFSLRDRKLDGDYAGALRVARSPEVRRWLIRETYTQARATDERMVADLPDQLRGEDRRYALAEQAMTCLQRGDETRAFRILNEIKFDESLEIFPSMGRVLGDPTRFLDWITAQKDGAPRHSLVYNLWKHWSAVDAEAAAAWAIEKNRHGGAAGVTLTPHDPVTKRLMSMP
ncbi:sigma-70 family RNA polymerase sigma factor [Luteolibacter sp. GHJ8]|uniref:Sigma-70 family RNA polymerase sigma factor n=1 Tax=Luteolibacter rhizosphaerae TaxID=2989719 RepID=A0ABT3FZU5_9BACT|nr:sigma-70 family RNA polymerase sigma factor [Luteolibacter rhizosphaerae]MCW1913114.1 sigma-70 family RNA polymerase sigma factor [Luteolibacter rhizosphaerae]